MWTHFVHFDLIPADITSINEDRKGKQGRHKRVNDGFVRESRNSASFSTKTIKRVKDRKGNTKNDFCSFYRRCAPVILSVGLYALNIFRSRPSFTALVF